MQRTRNAFTTTLLVATALAAPGAALHCNGTILVVPAGPETLYIDDRSDETGDVNHWVYVESNGVSGLQSGADDICFGCLYPIKFSDPCDHVSPDTLLI